MNADDVILEEDIKKFKELKSNIDGSVDLYQMKYNYILDANNNPILFEVRDIIKKRKKYKWVSTIHEVIISTVNIEKVDIAITHKEQKKRNLHKNIAKNVILW